MLFLRDQLKDVTGLGNVREIDLGFDLVVAAGCARGARAGRGSFGARFKNGAHLLSLVVLERTGVRLLLGDTSFRKNVENRLAFNFQLPSQIVDSNLLIRRLFLRPVPLSPHVNLTSGFLRRVVLRNRARLFTFFFSSFSASSCSAEATSASVSAAAASSRSESEAASISASASASTWASAISSAARRRRRLPLPLLRLRLLRFDCFTLNRFGRDFLTLGDDGFAAFQCGEVIIDRDADFFHRLGADAFDGFQLLGGHIRKGFDRADTGRAEFFDEALAESGNVFKRRGALRKSADICCSTS